MIELLVLIVLITASCLFGREAVQLVEDIYQLARERIRSPRQQVALEHESVEQRRKQISPLSLK